MLRVHIDRRFIASVLIKWLQRLLNAHDAFAAFFRPRVACDEQIHSHGINCEMKDTNINHRNGAATSSWVNKVVRIKGLLMFSKFRICPGLGLRGGSSEEAMSELHLFRPDGHAVLPGTVVAVVE